jgi:hypothetical protein
MHTLDQLRTGELAGITRLTLRCDLRTFPSEIFTLADSLEILDLSGNQLSHLPDDLPRLHKLRVIFCSDNQFTELPEVLGQCPHLTMVGFKANRIAHVSAKALAPQLRWLILTDNALTSLPAEIGQCTQLQKLMLAGNQLTALPPELAHCTRLELLRVSANQLSEAPEWLLHLPRLAWLAYAGNPFVRSLETQALTQAPTPHIAWTQLQLQQLLGEGASGVIHQAVLRAGPDAPTPVAVKLFKGAMTSDGLPDCEMSACMHMGQHPHLVGAIGRISDHPNGTQGLVMPLIDPTLRNLAGPPSLASCTRDVYPDGLCIGLDTLLRWVHAIASAMCHLHARGIVHGDLYGHNILCAPEGEALLGDFGAASFFLPHDSSWALGLQRLEVRAFGYLLQELLWHCDAKNSLETLQELEKIATACVQERPMLRPLFTQIVSTLPAQEVS